ncbi:MAG: hypothetical protein A2X84_09670 [Desulfuromonadaceae bacterium GWC2_58_13]|nr:MAG: hypothetical protein A2X84_09670 [Desulfuromonadaceae bacterium GWC2_58_13]
MRVGERQRLKASDEALLFVGMGSVPTTMTKAAESRQSFEAGGHLVTVPTGRQQATLTLHAMSLVRDAEMFVAEMVDGNASRLEWLVAVGALSLLPLPEQPANFRMMQNAPGEIAPSAVFAMKFPGFAQRHGCV